MQVHPDIAALRSDRAPQREAQTLILAARNAWAAEEGASELLAELEAYGEGAPLEACPVLEAVFTGQGEAERLMHALVKHYCKAIAENPLGHPPFRIGFNGVSTSILLGRSGRAQMMLQAREPGTFDNPSYILPDATRLDAVLAGEAQGRIVRRVVRGETACRFDEEVVALRAGGRYAFDLSSESLMIDVVDTRFVVLRLMRTAENPAPAREYCAETGAFLHQCAGNIATSRLEALIATLGRMGREDAAPAIAAIALDEGDSSLRWQAVREALSLDSKTGFAALAEIAARAGDPLAANAGALRAQLCETYPQFAQWEARQCPA
ncbi:hypothetical protein [Aurantiacibacter gangjinensis]|uniref:Uncharacterized protein n=1 Tax=Aurantiacibacter gangjinensis TaxID=502682 RepID=A0A0G9MN02_9SPHN|nr:hypothetical protein [Aurantiacibacter gangjinensis]APE28187.1 hypothetical protein BMF35_a1358 [Aurantiacibacter gangjinensis]KLE32092.1 hypothetical protein AAW01_11815 [Aurantiacibacter gangjinensis]